MPPDDENARCVRANAKNQRNGAGGILQLRHALSRTGGLVARSGKPCGGFDSAAAKMQLTDDSTPAGVRGVWPSAATGIRETTAGRFSQKVSYQPTPAIGQNRNSGQWCTLELPFHLGGLTFVLIARNGSEP